MRVKSEEDLNKHWLEMRQKGWGDEAKQAASLGGMCQMFKSSLENCPNERSTRGGSKQVGQVSRGLC